MRKYPQLYRPRSPLPRLDLKCFHVALAAVLLVLILAPSTALAHTRLERSSPADSARLGAVPREIRLIFSGPVELAFTRLELVGPGGGVVDLGPVGHPADSASVVVARVLQLPAAGTYTVVWQTAGPDGHPLRGQFVFTVEAGAAGLPAEGPPAPAARPSEPAAPAGGVQISGFDAESPLYVAVRWLTFAGMLGLIGTVAFRVLVLSILHRGRHAVTHDFLSGSARRAARLGLIVTVVLLAAALLRLIAQSFALHGAEGALGFTSLRVMLTRTTWGWGWLLQVAATAVALIGLVWERRQHTFGWALAALGAVALAFTPALSGHAVANPKDTTLAVIADGLHVLGAGGWLGGLLVVIAVGLPMALRLPQGQRGPQIHALIDAFSPTALFFAGTVVATGVLSAWLNMESVSALWTSAYGQTLLLKLAVLSLVFATGAYNWLRVRPALGTVESAARLRRSSALELAVGVLVLAVTAVLVATPPPGELADTASAANTVELVQEAELTQ